MGCGQHIFDGQSKCGYEDDFCVRCLHLEKCAVEIEKLREGLEQSQLTLRSIGVGQVEFVWDRLKTLDAYIESVLR